jgi:hypothetical protein
MSYQTYYKKILNSIVAFLVLIAVSSTPMSFANQQSAPAPNPYTDARGLSVARCLAQGNHDFILFLRSMSFNEGPVSAAVELWKDVLARNQCQSQDVLRLLKQADKIRAAIRQAFLTCATHKLPGLKTAYNRTLVEIYYVRNVVDSSFVLGMPFEVLTLQVGTEEALNFDLYNTMREKYVNNFFFTQVEFDQIFINLESKYRDRKNSYIVCDTGDWNEVKEKWDEFKTFFTEDIGEQFSTGVSDLRARADNVRREAATIKTVELLRGKTTFGDYMESILKVNLNNEDFKIGAERIEEQFQNVMPRTGTTVSQTYVLDALAGAQKTYEINKIRYDLEIEFANTYFTVSDRTGEILLNTLDGRGVMEDGLIEIIEETLPVLYELRSKTSSIHRNQCR